MYKKALYWFDKAIEYDQRWKDTYLNRALAYRALKMYNRSISDLYYALELDSLSAEIYYQLGLTFEECQQQKNVVKNYRIAIILDPSHEQAHLNLGKFYFYQGKYKPALNHFDRVFEINKHNFWVLYWKALSYDKLKDYLHARRYYNLFIEQAPKVYSGQIRFCKRRINQLASY